MTVAPLRLIVATNPQAAFGRNSDVGAQVTTALSVAGHEVTMLREPNIELLRRETQRAVERGADALIVVGGDGMVSLGTNIVAGTPLPLGIVASGTGNDMARGLGLPVGDTEASILALLAAFTREPRVIDAATVRHGELTTWFACVLSAGFDAIVNDRANRMTWPKGPSRYILALLRELATFKPIAYTLTVDGVALEQRAMLVAVANNVSLGGGMRITPDAVLDDGLLDLFIVTPLSRLAMLRVFPKVFAGTHTDHPAVRITRARSIRLEAADIIAYADGERVGPLPIDIDVVPGALRVLA